MRPQRFALALTLTLPACVGTRDRGPATPAAPDNRGVQAHATDCTTVRIGVQVLGSGGPTLDPARASSGYVVWHGGKARVLVDLGAAAVATWSSSGASVDDLDAVLFTHLHVDHSAGLPALLKAASFGDRKRPLPVVGPAGSEAFPSLPQYIEAVFGPAGSYRYLGGFIGDGEPFVLRPSQVELAGGPRPVFESEDLTVQAVGVPHGPVPALAYVVELDGVRVAFMGDQRADEQRYVDMIAGADLLVAHMAVGSEADPIAANLHASPDRLGRVAAQAGVKAMVLSHLMPRAIERLDDNIAAVAEHYRGSLVIAQDGMCVAVMPSENRRDPVPR